MSELIATAQFSPVIVTVETLQILSKQEKYADLLALYMAYVEMTTRQDNNSVWATTRFMSNRLHWNKDKITRVKKKLVSLSLVEDVIRKDEKGKITGHYILVKHVIKPDTGFEYPLDSEGQNAYDSKVSANDSKISMSKDPKYSPEQLEDIEFIYKLWLVEMVVDPDVRSSTDFKLRHDAYLQAMKHTKLTPLRKTKIASRLADAGRPMIAKAIKNIAKSEFHRNGTEDSKWTAKLEWLCKSYEKVEEWSNK